MRSTLCQRGCKSVGRIEDVHACVVIRDDVVSFVAAVAQVQSGAITQG